MIPNHQIHGHKILEIIAAHPAGIQRSRLVELVGAEFGSGARFNTCSAEDMSLAELLVFLGDRNKIEVRDNVIFPGGSPACSHDHDHGH